jgi:flagellar hook-associated protein 3 FlgL
MMRISTGQLYDRSIQAIVDNQAELSDLQQQLATGKRILRPSDDPVGSTKVIRLTEELAQIAQYQKNNNVLTNALEQEETVMRNINQSLDRARVLMIQSGNGIVGDEERQAIANEISQIRSEVFDLMNTQNASGEYIFAGFQSHSPAFAFNAANPGNKFTFEGDEGIRDIQISNEVKLASNSSGKDVFENVLARFTSSITATAGVTSASMKISLQDNFDRFFDQNYDNLTPANNAFRITIQAGNQVQIVNQGTGAVMDVLPFTSGDPFTFNGLEFTINGVVGDTVDFQLDPPEKKNIAETLNDFVIALSDDNLSDSDFDKALADAVVGIDNGMETLSSSIAFVGGRLNTAQSVFASNLDAEIVNQSARSRIEDVDYAEAVSELSKQETALQASQATFGRVTGLTLFDFI